MKSHFTGPNMVVLPVLQAANPYIVKLSILDDELALTVSLTLSTITPCFHSHHLRPLEPNTSIHRSNSYKKIFEQVISFCFSGEKRFELLCFFQLIDL